MARFGLSALTSATHLVKRFETPEARGLLAGMAAHSILPLGNLSTSAIALVLMAYGHLKGWPVPKGGSSRIAIALAGYFDSICCIFVTITYITSMEQLPSAHAVLFDISPRQLLQIAEHR